MCVIYEETFMCSTGENKKIVHTNIGLQTLCSKLWLAKFVALISALIVKMMPTDILGA